MISSFSPSGVPPSLSISLSWHKICCLPRGNVIPRDGVIPRQSIVAREQQITLREQVPMDSAFQPTLHRETTPDIEASHTIPGARILFENISKIYSTSDGPMLAIDDVTFGVSQGEFVSIVGPSGCGKSTLLMLTSGLLLPTQGRISIDEETISRPYTNIGFMFQQDN